MKLLNETNVRQCKDAELARDGTKKEMCDIMDEADCRAFFCKKSEPCMYDKVKKYY